MAGCDDNTLHDQINKYQHCLKTEDLDQLNWDDSSACWLKLSSRMILQKKICHLCELYLNLRKYAEKMTHYRNRFSGPRSTVNIQKFQTKNSILILCERKPIQFEIDAITPWRNSQIMYPSWFVRPFGALWPPPNTPTLAFNFQTHYVCLKLYSTLELY